MLHVAGEGRCRSLFSHAGIRAHHLAAHRDTHFTFIRDLKIGDEITLERIDGSDAAYRVRGFETVRWDEFTYPAHGGDGLLALATCWPFGSQTRGPLRRVVWAERVGGA